MIDSDTLLPLAREKLLTLCSLLSQSSNPEHVAHFTKQIEQTALDIGFVFAADLVHLGWTADQKAAAAIEERLGGAIATALAA